MLEQRAGEAAKLIVGTAEIVALPPPDVGCGGHRGRGEKAQAQERQGAIACVDVTSPVAARSCRDVWRGVGIRPPRYPSLAKSCDQCEQIA